MLALMTQWAVIWYNTYKQGIREISTMQSNSIRDGVTFYCFVFANTKKDFAYIKPLVISALLLFFKHYLN